MERSTPTADHRITRRSLVKLGSFVATALAVGGWKAASSESATEATAAGAGPAGVASGVVTCVLTPEQTEGPYYVEDAKIRRNITEGKQGVALTLRLTVVDASTCKPIKGAAVDIWHCDAGGIYSGVDMQQTVGRAFLRGIQRTDAKGVATLQTIYPGWYQSRTVHIHVKVHVRGNVVHTGQLYFPDTLTDAVYKRTPYSSRTGRDTRNAADNVYRNGGKTSLLSLRKNGAGYIGTITMGVQTS